MIYLKLVRWILLPLMVIWLARIMTAGRGGKSSQPAPASSDRISQIGETPSDRVADGFAERFHTITNNSLMFSRPVRGRN